LIFKEESGSGYERHIGLKRRGKPEETKPNGDFDTKIV